MATQAQNHTYQDWLNSVEQLAGNGFANRAFIDGKLLRCRQWRNL